jgi:glycosyltransferase involved in cell wall biosynthesis
MTTKVSVIVPVYNEAATILQILEQVAAQKVAGYEFEVIVIDDGSRDNTIELLAGRTDLYARLIKRTRNGGKGAAVKDGLDAATGEFILFQDADLEYDPADYSKLLEPVTRFEADVVMGSRLVAAPITRVSYFWHRVGNRFITLFFNILNNTTFTDIYTCYLLYRRRLVDSANLHTSGWQQHAEILSIAVAGARSIYEVPISYYGRTYAEGKKIRASHVIGILLTIVAARIHRDPGSKA